MKTKLPKSEISVESVTVRQEAKDTVDKLIERNLELEEVFDLLQPLLYSLSVKLYGQDGTDVSLHKLIADSLEHINGKVGELQ